MDKFVVTSLREGAGKTSLIIGIAKVLNRKIGYLKPLGERFVYRKKRLCDYDAVSIANIFGLEESPDELSIGFHHAKLTYMLDEITTREKLHELTVSFGNGKELFFVECGKDLSYGVSVHLDALTLARDLQAQLIVVVSGDEDAILDDVIFFKKHIQVADVRCKGIIINKVANVTDFCETRLPKIQRQGIDVLGVIPYCRELSFYSVGHLADCLFAKIIVGEAHLNRTVRSIFIGPMSVDVARMNPLFKEEGRVVVTTGDRRHLIDAALESNAAAVVLTNDIQPPIDLVSKAGEKGIPLLLVSADTCEIVKLIEEIETLPTKDDLGKIALIERMVRTHVNLQALIQP